MQRLEAMDIGERTARVVAMGRRYGFDDVGVASPGPHPEMQRFVEWMERGYDGEMRYLYRHRKRRLDNSRGVRGLKSVIVVAMDYDTPHPRSTEVEPDAERGWISRYAWGDDYHEVLEPKLRAWSDELDGLEPEHTFYHYVDHGPVLEKVFARYAGIGWMGKHTNIIHPERGSYFFLAVILTTLELEHGAPIDDRCGTCTACLDACPTGAFPMPYVLDARRCLSYLTIEIKSEIPSELRGELGQQVFGCDICQDVCPWNKKPVPPDRPEFRPRDGLLRPRLEELASMSESEFEARMEGSPLRRPGWERLRANAALVARGLRGGDDG